MTLTDTDGAMAGPVSASQTFLIVAGSQITLTFTWDTTGASTDTHTLTAFHELADDDDATNDSASTTSTVSEPVDGPTVTGIDPNTMSTNTSGGVTITGSGFDAATVAFTGGSGPTPSASIDSVVDGQIIATVTVKRGGPSRVRVWDVVVTNFDGSSVTVSGGFTVTPP